MIHRVVLSNGRVLLVEEDNATLHIGVEQECQEYEFEAYICRLDCNGVQVMTNSGDVVGYVTEHLTKAGNQHGENAAVQESETD